jgi:hypothetical protein
VLEAVGFLAVHALGATDGAGSFDACHWDARLNRIVRFCATKGLK